MSNEQIKNPADPSTKSAEYEHMAPKWEKIRTLLEGTEAMRAVGQKYLPRHEEETDLGYRARLEGNVLLNRVEHTLATLVGKPFSEPLKLAEDLPEKLKEILDDIDLQGNSLDVFARNWFQEGLTKAFCDVLVEFPKKDKDVKTLEDQRKAGLRPYWVMLIPENVLAVRMQVVKGVETLTHMRILESFTEVVGFVEIPRRRIRVLEPGKTSIYEPELDKNGQEVKGENDRVKWKLSDEYDVALRFIPNVTFYAHREGFRRGKPPLEDLADLNITHWQSNSEQRHILTVARFPILACSGSGGPEADDSDDITIGPNKVLYVPDAQGKFYYVEHTGTSIEAGRKDLESLETQMADYGAAFLRKKPGGETATAAAIDTAESSTQLGAMIKVFADALAHALWVTAQWLGLGEDFETTVGLNMKWSTRDDSLQSRLQTLTTARDKKEISHSVYVNTLKEWGILPESYDCEEDEKELEEERWMNLSPQEVTAIQAIAQAKQISFSEVREIWRKAGIASLDNEAAKDEMDSTMDFGPGLLGSLPFPPGKAPPPEEKKPPVPPQENPEPKEEPKTE